MGLKSLVPVKVIDEWVERGQAYRYSAILTPDDQTIYTLVRIPNVADTWRGLFFFSSTQEARIAVYRDPTTTADGTEKVFRNINQTYDDASGTDLPQVFDAPTVSATGSDLIFEAKVGSGGLVFGSVTPFQDILRPNTDYLILDTGDAVGCDVTPRIEIRKG